MAHRRDFGTFGRQVFTAKDLGPNRTRPYVRSADIPPEGELEYGQEWERYEKKNRESNIRYEMEKDSIDWRYDPTAIAAKPRKRSLPRPGQRGYRGV